MNTLPTPIIRHLPDAPREDWYVLEEDFYAGRWYGQDIWIPRGYISDGCSVPNSAVIWFPPLGRYFVPGMLHDYLYESKPEWVNRYLADKIFLEMLNRYAPTTKKRNYIRWLAVRWFGKRRWHNAKYIDIGNYKG